MPLNYLKRFRYTLHLKFGPFIPSPSNFWSTYALLGVSWPTRNIQLILLLFKCQMNFPRYFYVLSLDIYIQGKRVKYAPKLLKRSRYTLHLKFGPFIPSPSNFWTTYALLGVSWTWPTRNIQLILLYFKCQMDFFHVIFILPLDI